MCSMANESQLSATDSISSVQDASSCRVLSAYKAVWHQLVDLNDRVSAQPVRVASGGWATRQLRT